MNKTMIKLIALLALLLAGNSQAAQSVTFYHHDALGSVMAKSDEDGYLYLNEEYQPYGEKIYATEDLFGGSDDWYTGKNYSEELDLTYFGARWYDAKQGRFLSVDPAPVLLESIHSFNRYHYANNNPYKYVDPDGEQSIDLDDDDDDSDYAIDIDEDDATLHIGGGPRTRDVDGIRIYSISGAYGLAGAGGGVFGGKASVGDTKGTSVFRQGTFANDAKDWKGNYVIGKEWANRNPLSTSDYAKKYGLPAENSGKPDWVVKGTLQGPYTVRPAPGSHNNPANKGGAKEIIPSDPSDVRLNWFHMTD